MYKQVRLLASSLICKIRLLASFFRVTMAQIALIMFPY